MTPDEAKERTVFSDEDLKQFKENLSANLGVVFYINDIEALLARLEAAENWADLQRTFRYLPQEEFDTSEGDGYVIREAMDEAEKEWRRKAGKDAKCVCLAHDHSDPRGACLCECHDEAGKEAQ